MITDTGRTTVEKRIIGLNGHGVEIGIFEPKIAQYAFYNEYGTKNKDKSVRIPERPFFRPVQYEVDKAVVKTFAGKIFFGNAVDGLRAVGLHVKNKLVKKIMSTVPPPNKPSTIAKKGHGLTLRDSYDMVRSIEYVFK